MTGKKSILGTFSDVNASVFPAAHPELCLYVALTEGHGTQPLRIRIVDLDEAHEPIFEANESIHFCNPRTVSEATMKIEFLQFPRPGEYAIQLFVGGEFLAERRLTVRSNEA